MHAHGARLPVGAGSSDRVGVYTQSGCGQRRVRAGGAVGVGARCEPWAVGPVGAAGGGLHDLAAYVVPAAEAVIAAVGGAGTTVVVAVAVLSLSLVTSRCHGGGVVEHAGGRWGDDDRGRCAGADRGCRHCGSGFRSARSRCGCRSPRWSTSSRSRRLLAADRRTVPAASTTVASHLRPPHVLEPRLSQDPWGDPTPGDQARRRARRA